MNKNLEFYIKSYQLLDSETCKKTIADIENEHWRQHTFYNPIDKSGVPLSGDRELDVCYENTSTKDLIMKNIWNAYHNYIQELQFSWFDGWQGFSSVRFNRYKETRQMAEHCDHIHSLFDGERKGIPTLTALGLLNDDYRGGELIFFGDKIVPFKMGEIKIFPSCFLFPHRIEPVTEGTRYSFVSWAW
jgi:hypothetical protein